MPTPSEQLLSRTIYDIDGTTTVWDFSFAGGYLDAAHVKAYTELPTGARTTVVVTPEMLIGEFQLQITPALSADSGVLVIYRETPKDLPLVDFTEGALTEIALDTNAKQAVFVAAEAQDAITTSNFGAAIDAAVSANNSALSANNSALSAAGSAATAGAAADSVTAAVDMAVDGKKDLFTAGVHYTINVSTALTLTAAPAQQNAVHVYFDGVYQNKDTYTLAGTTLTFTSAIDVGSVEVQYAVPSMYVGLTGDFSDLAATGGSALVGYDGGTVQDVLDSAKPMQSYTELRDYTGRATTARITAPGIAGFFTRRGTTGLTDNGGTVIVGEFVWERIYTGMLVADWFEAYGDGVTDVSAKLAGKSVAFKNGVYRFSASAALGAVVFSPGASILADSGVTVTFASVKTDSQDAIFSGAGTVFVSDRYYVLSWYAGSSANAKWDFMRRGFPAENRSWSVVIPRPKAGDAATADTGALGGLMWKVTAPMFFDDPEGNAKIYADAGFSAAPASGTLAAIFEFSPTNKTENVTFETDLRFVGNGVCDAGVLFRGGAHIRLRDIYSSGVSRPVHMLANLSCNDITGGVVYSAGQTGPVIDIEGLAGGQVQDCHFEHISTDGTTTASPAVAVYRQAGIVRNCTLPGGVTMYAVTAGLRDVTDALVVIESNSAGTPRNKIRVGACYNYSTKITSKSGIVRRASGSNTVSDVLFDAGGWVSSGDAFDLSNCELVTISNHRTGAINIQASADYTQITTVNQFIITDNGRYTLVNGRIRRYYSSIEDDTAVAIPIKPDQQPLFRLRLTALNSTNFHNADFAVSIGAGTPIVFVSGGSNLNIATGVLTGTSGVDGKLNVSATSDGNLYVENRTSASLRLVVEVD